VGCYQHHNGKVVAVVELRCETDFMAKSKEFKELAEELAMHIAAANPRCLSLSHFRTEYPDEYASLKTAYKHQVESLGRPDHMAVRIVSGKISKWCKENCLEDQILVTREAKISVTDATNLLERACRESVWIEKFHRMELGTKI
jgi:elongation factor Ts